MLNSNTWVTEIQHNVFSHAEYDNPNYSCGKDLAISTVIFKST